MIRTNHPLALVATLVVLLVAVVALDPGLIAPLASSVGVDVGGDDLAFPDSANESLIAADGTVVAERRYTGTPDRIERKRANYSRAPEIRNATEFINRDSVSLSQYVGEKVILIEFWTFGCSYCQDTHPHIKGYWREYKDEGLVVIGVHRPEFDYERDPANVREYVRDSNTTYPVVLDNGAATWDAYPVGAWPTRYLIGVDGFIRHEYVGAGGYAKTERRIQQLLTERDRVVNGTDG